MPEAADLLGAKEYSLIFTKSNRLFPEEIWNGSTEAYSLEYVTIMNVDNPVFTDSMDKIEDEFYSLEDFGNNIWNYMSDYIYKNSEEFFTF